MKNKFPLIRIGIYETNSSSSHSFTLGPQGRLSGTLEPTEGDTLVVYLDDWEEVTKFNTPYLKLSYLLCFVYTIHEKRSGNTLTKKGVEVVEGILKIVKDFTGIKNIDVRDLCLTRIDHQSIDLIDPRDLNDQDFIKEFIFNPETWVYPLWDTSVVSSDFFEGRGKPILYTLVYDLPGIDDPIRIDVKYGESEETVRCHIHYELSKFVWSGEKFYPWAAEGEKSPCLLYTDMGSWGSYQVEPTIILPNDKI